jgi:hypothetical protein
LPRIAAEQLVGQLELKKKSSSNNEEPKTAAWLAPFRGEEEA